MLVDTRYFIIKRKAIKRVKLHHISQWHKKISTKFPSSQCEEETRNQITSEIGSFWAFRAALTRIPSFSSCLEKTRIRVAELRKSSSNFSTLLNKLLPWDAGPFGNPAPDTLRHCRRRITAPTTILATKTTHCHTKILLPTHPKTAPFCTP